mmetsp:Transcript_63366/g.142927  ORF Transcript_63366/g.142927 Transcript_63366/m.142927 type:complete len:220 (-) Transcript_63366:546-1205(-)
MKPQGRPRTDDGDGPQEALRTPRDREQGPQRWKQEASLESEGQEAPRRVRARPHRRCTGLLGSGRQAADPRSAQETTAREEEEFPEEVREHEVERGGAVVARLDHRLEDGRPPEKQLLVHHQMHSCRQHTGQRSHEPELLASNDPARAKERRVDRDQDTEGECHLGGRHHPGRETPPTEEHRCHQRGHSPKDLVQKNGQIRGFGFNPFALERSPRAEGR